MATASPASRSIGVATICAAIGLAFCFIIGLAGGTAYKLWTAAAPKPQLADAATAPKAMPAPPELAAAPTPPADAETAAKVTPSAPPSAPPVAVAAANPPPAPPAATIAAPAPAPVAHAAAPPASAPIHEAEAAPAPPAAKPHAAAPAHPAATEKPVRLAAKAEHPANPSPGTQSASLQSPPAAAALANRPGPFLIQFGAFADEANAHHVQWAIEATGLKVDVSATKGASGHPLYLLRSADYPDYAAAAGAAQSVREHVKHFANPIAIDYAIEADHSDTVQVQADAH